jgi:hypothetical protein
VREGPDSGHVVGLLLRLVGVLGIDAVGSAPHCDFADEGGARVTPRRCPDWRGVTLAGAILDLVGEVGDELGSLCQVGRPNGMGMQR